MNHSSCATCSSYRRQRGAASLAIAALLMFILVAAVTAVVNISGSSVLDAAKNEEQISALFLAESGVESAKAIISAANQAGTYSAGTCTGMTTSAQSLGRGTFRFNPAPTCSGGSPCVECNVTVEGVITGTSTVRIIRTKISTANTQGTEGCGSNPALELTTTGANFGVFTNLAYRSKWVSGMCGTGGGSNANVGACDIFKDGGGLSPYNIPPWNAPDGVISVPQEDVGNCAPTTDGWNLQRTGINNVSGMGVFSKTMTNAGLYRIAQTIVDNSNNLTPRNYVQTGVMLAPPTLGAVDLAGSFGADTGSDKTTGTSQDTGSVPGTWNCAANNGTAAWTKSATANTLLYGFSSWPAIAGTQLNEIHLGYTTGSTFNSTHAMRYQIGMTGTQGDSTYSQIWYSYNHAYAPNPTSGGATHVASFMGASGATVTGSITGTTLSVTSNSGGVNFGQLRAGDLIAGAGVTTGTRITATGCTGGGITPPYTCTVDQNHTTPVSSTTLTATSSILRVTAPVNGVISAGPITTTTSAIAGPLTILPFSTLGTTGTGGTGDYVLSAPVSPLNTSTFPASIRLIGATNPPIEGTAIALVSAGTGRFDFAKVTGRISGNTLTVSTVQSGSLNVGDALFGINVKPDTYITVGSGGAGNYTVNTTHPVQTSDATIFVRAAVRGSNTDVTLPSATLYAVSRTPTIAFSGSAQLCGGICAMHNNILGLEFKLFNLNSNDDWASGFTCLTGVDPNGIKTLGTVSVKRSSWSEPVR